MKKRIYLSGPMTGLDHFNFPAFNAEAERLRAEGNYVINPAEHGEEPNQPWGFYLRKDIKLMMDCDHIHLLPGWSKSKGATLELHIARELGFTVSGAPL